MKLAHALVAVGLASFALANRGETPRPAKALLDETVAAAKSEHKVVFLSFHASWCIWCHRLDDFLKDEKIKPVVDKHIKVLWLDCQETEAKKNLENPGVDEVRETYKATEAGLPSMFIIDGDGKLVASSIREKGGNIGYPGEPDEIAHFMTLMKSAGLNEAEQKVIEAELKVRAAKLKNGTGH